MNYGAAIDEVRVKARGRKWAFYGESYQQKGVVVPMLYLKSETRAQRGFQMLKVARTGIEPVFRP